MSSPPHLVVGAGFAGLAAALRLRARGEEVVLLERLDQLGGRARVHRRNGFVFDAGPTVITAPFLFEELFALFDRRLDDAVEMLPVDPWYRMVFDDGSVFDYGGTLDDTLREIERFEPRDRDGYLRLLAHSERLFAKGFEELGDQPFDRVSTMLKAAPDLARLRADRSVWGLVRRCLRNPQLRQAFSLQPLLVGGNPLDTTSIYSLIHALERRWGVTFPRGGTGALVAALGELAQDVGVEVRLGESVSRFEVRDGRVRAAVLKNGERLTAQRVVFAGDPSHLYRHLIAAEDRRHWTDARLARHRHSMGLFVWYFATDRRYPDVAHHTILFGPRYEELLEDIFDRGHLADDPSLYLHRPTATDPAMAPDGHDAFYVLAPVPHLGHGGEWREQAPRYRQLVLERLESTVLPGLESALVEDFVATPETFRDDFLSHLGAGFSLQPTLRQSAYFRFHNRSEDIENLYLVGAGTHPGAGLPGVLTSAKVLERLLDEEAA
ncbi:MAG: phytoene desaturase family protein [Acidobacteriota bacterium]